MARAGTVTLSLEEIQIGGSCSHPIQDEAGLVLIGADARITEQMLQALRERGIDRIEVDAHDAEKLRTGDAHLDPNGHESAATANDSAKNAGRAKVAEVQWRATEPLKSMLVDRHDEGLSPQRGERLADALNSAREALQALKPGTPGLNEAAVNACGEISDAYARALIDDCDQTLGSVMSNASHTNLADRNVQMAVMAMAVGVEMGLDGTQTVNLGTAGLLHDIGLFMMDPRFLDPTQSLTEADLWEYQKHPLIAYEHLSEIAEFPQSVELAIQQVHEQFDGSGYPRGLSGRRIHLHARILNVVDTYLQLTCPMVNRPAIVAHDAIGMILHQATRGRFDPRVVRAFLTTETLFPLGSCVELDSGEIARVIRRPRIGYAFPVLQNLDGQRIELETGSREVIRPALDPTNQQMRLSIEMMLSGCDTNGVPLLAI